MKRSTERWKKASETGCPFLRYDTGLDFFQMHGEVQGERVGGWLSANRPPPCSEKTCGLTACHRFGKSAPHERLVILKRVRQS